MTETEKLKFMELALTEAEQAYAKGEVPVGAIVVDENNTIIGRGHNLRESNNLATAHAEIIAIEQACRNLNSWRLEGCSLFVTLEPCFMCAGAIVLSRIKSVIYSTPDPKAGAAQSLAQVLTDPRLNHRCVIETGVYQEKASALLKDFFKARRGKKS